MIDMPEDYNRWPFLRHVAGEHRDVLVETYLDSDRTSLAAQSQHERWVLCAAFLATLAVSLAILQLAGLRSRGIVWLEVMSVFLAALTFWWSDKSRKEWLRERHKAERCRFLKFGSLISPELHTQGGLPVEGSTSQLSGEIESLKNIAYEDVEKWLAQEELPSPPGRIALCSLEELVQLRDYYREKRLEFQAAYFKRQSERDVKRPEVA